MKVVEKTLLDRINTGEKFTADQMKHEYDNVMANLVTSSKDSAAIAYAFHICVEYGIDQAEKIFSK